MKEYQKTKSVKVIEMEKGEKKKVEIKDDMMDKDPLYAALSTWRLHKAQDANVPAFTIAHNKVLKAIAMAKPMSLLELKKVKGIGDNKAKLYGPEILDIVLRSMGENPETADIGTLPEVPEKKEKKQRGDSERITKEMLDKGMTVEAIAKERGLAVSTIYGHLAHLVEQGTLEASQFVAEEKYNEILDYFESTFDPNVTAAKDVLGDDYQYGEIKAVLAELQREHFFEDQVAEED